jgi:hypothetical protein
MTLVMTQPRLPLNVIGVGDAENDHAFLTLCGMSAAVANAVPAVIGTADIALKRDHGAGVSELIDLWLAKSGGIPDHLVRGAISVAEDRADEAALLNPAAAGATLIVGRSGAGKSNLAAALIERAHAAGAQIVVLDPEGDYEALEDVAHIGASDRAPKVSEVIELIGEDAAVCPVVKLLPTPLSDRPAFLAEILGGLSALRVRLGRPHWVLIDEAHHFLPAEANGVAAALPKDATGLIFVTVNPEALAPAALETVSTFIALGRPARDLLADFCMRCRAPPPDAPQPGDDEILLWRRGETRALTLKAAQARQQHTRHIRKYAEGALGIDKSFYFRGPGNRLNLRARNLHAFLDLADGVDDETWRYHLRAHDYSAWMREAIGDEELAREVEQVEAEDAAANARDRVRAAIERRYTAPQ